MATMITIGDVEGPIEKQLLDDLNAYIDEIYHTGIDQAWFAVFMKFRQHGVFTPGNVFVPGKVLHIKLIVMDHEPPKLLGTACYHANYRQGKVTRLWMLPFDNPKAILEAEVRGYIADGQIRKTEGTMRETETFEDAQAIKPALIHSPPGRLQ